MTESVILLCYYKDKIKEEGLAMNNNIITKVLYKIDNNYGTVSLELKIVF